MLNVPGYSFKFLKLVAHYSAFDKWDLAEWLERRKAKGLSNYSTFMQIQSGRTVPWIKHNAPKKNQNSWVNIYHALMLCYNNVCLQFTDIISRVVTGEVSPTLSRAQDHAVFLRATTRLSRVPVFIVQGCPIAPFPCSLYTAVHHLYHKVLIYTE